MSALPVATLSRDEARSLTDEVKGDAERLWLKLVELYDGEAWGALGYGSWRDYWIAEFGEQSLSLSYKQITAGRVANEIGVDDRPHLNQTQARELAPLLDRPGRMREAWAEARDRNDGVPTAAEIREVVREYEPQTKRQTEIAGAAKTRVERAVGTCNGLARGLIELRVEQAVSVATRDEIVGWNAAFNEAVTSIRRLQQRLKEAQA